MGEPTQVETRVVSTSAVHRSQAARLLQGNGLLLAGAGVFSLLSARALGPEGRGQVALVVQGAYVVAFAAAGGIDRALPLLSGRRYSLPEALDTGLSAGRRYLVAVTAVGATAALLGLMGSGGAAAWALVLGSAMAVAGSVNHIYRASTVLAGRAEKATQLAAVTSLGYLALSLALAVTDVSSPAIWLAAATLGPTAAMAVFTWRGCHRICLPASRPSSEALAVRRSGLQQFVPALATFTALRADRLLLPLLASPSALGRYVTVATVAEVIALPAAAMAESSLPVWSRNEGDPNRSLMLYLLGAVVAGGLTALVAPVVLEILLPTDFGDLRPLMSVLLLASVALGASRLLVYRNLAQHRNHWLARGAEPLGLIAALLGYVLLIGPWGEMGAAVGSLIGYSVIALLAALVPDRVRP